MSFVKRVFAIMGLLTLSLPAWGGDDVLVFRAGQLLDLKQGKLLTDQVIVIQAATVHAAELLRWKDDVGAVASGYFADVIAVDGNPLDDVTTLGNVGFVIKGGQVYKE